MEDKKCLVCGEPVVRSYVADKYTCQNYFNDDGTKACEIAGTEIDGKRWEKSE